MFAHFLKKSALLILVFLGFSKSTHAQYVTGIVSDDSGPMSYVNALLYTASDSNLVRGELTDDAGYFQISATPETNYYVEVSMIGYGSFQSPVFSLAAGENYDLGDILLSEGLTLEAVELVAKKPLFEQKIDRLAINVAESINMSAGSVLDALEKSPGVLVNRQNEAISMLGKDGVVIMINGKISQAPPSAVISMLSGISANNVEKIELITTPPSKFDAEGNAGFVNIILKDDTQEGWYGNYSLSAGYNTGENLGATLFSSYQKDKLAVFGSYSFNRNRSRQDVRYFRRVNNGTNILESLVTSERFAIQQDHNVRLGVDYALSDDSNVGFIVTSFDEKWTMDATSENSIYSDNLLSDSTFVETTELNQWRHYGANIHYDKKLGGGHTLNVDSDYLFFVDNNPNDYIIDYFDASGPTLLDEVSQSTKLTPINIWVAKADLNGQLNDKFGYETGVKTSQSFFENDVAYQKWIGNNWIVEDRFTNFSNLNERIYAAYFSTNTVLENKDEVKLGLRYEYTDSKLNTEKEGTVVDRQFGALFPTLYYSKFLSERSKLNFSYNRRITRPTFNDMAPFVIFVEPRTYFFGNSALQPAISDNVKVDFTLDSYILSFQYMFQDSTISRFQNQVDIETNEQLITPLNLSNTQLFSGNLTVPIFIGNNINIQNNFFLGYRINAFYEENEFYEIGQLGGTANSTVNWTLAKGFSAEASMMYISKRLVGLATLNPIYLLNVGFQKKLKREGDVIRISGNDLLNSLKWDFNTDFNSDEFVIEGFWDFSQPTIMVSFSSTFGHKENRRSREGGAREERNRVN